MRVDVASRWLAYGENSDRATATSYLAAVGAISLYVAVALVIAPFGAQRLPEIPGIMPFLGAVILTTDLSTSFFLLVMFGEFRRPSLLVLACAYLFAAAMAALNIATFPGVLARDAIVFGSGQSYPWITQIFWVGYATFCFAAVVIECIPVKLVPPAAIGRAIATGLMLTLLLVCGIGEVATRFADSLPPITHVLPPAPGCAGPAVDGPCAPAMVATPGSALVRYASFALMVLAVGLGAGIAGRRSRVFLWFSVSTACALSVNVLSVMGGTRFSLGWTIGRVGWMVSSCVLFLFFMAQVAGQLRLLARTADILEQRVQDRTAALEASLKERDLLLREVYHRVKNNIQVVDSMLFLERRKLDDPKALAVFDTVRERIAALGLVHQYLMSSGNLEHFDIAPFLQELAGKLGQFSGAQDRGFELLAQSDAVLVNLDFALPLGLIATELVTNSIKHGRSRRVTMVFARRLENRASLTVAEDDWLESEASDHGVGVVDGPAAAGIGSAIVSGLVKQLNGRLTIMRQNGWTVEVDLPLPKAS